MKNIEPIILSLSNGIYTIDQFVMEGKPYLRMGARSLADGTYPHEYILLEFAEEAGVKTEKRSIGARMINDFLDKKHKLVGAGYCELTLERRSMLLFGKSEEYMLSIDINHMKEIQPNSGTFGLRYSPRKNPNI